MVLSGFYLLTLSPFGHWLIRLLALSVFLYGIGHGAQEYARRKGSDAYWTKKLKGVVAGTTIAQRTSLMLVGVILGYMIGYGSRDSELANRQQTYTAVTVVTKIAERDFIIWPERMKKLHIQICPESIVDWREGDVLDDWTFEQMQDCKRVISYHKNPQGEMNASLQTR